MEKFIDIKGAKMHNLKNIDLKIQHSKITVITGLSGSGKSTIAFDTIFAEGQRRYIESLSSYARQFLGKLDKPKVEYIKGIAPSIAIEQKKYSNNPRSTVGTTTEIYDYIKSIFSIIGKTISPISGCEVKKDSTSNVIDKLRKIKKNTRCLILSPISFIDKTSFQTKLNILKEQGYARIFINNKIFSIDELIIDIPKKIHESYLIVDRISINFDKKSNINRYNDSINLAFIEGNGKCIVYIYESQKKITFSKEFELDNIKFTEPNEHFFTFNNPVGACKKCNGLGITIDVDPNLVIPNKNISLFDGAIAPWKGEKMIAYKNKFIKHAKKYNFPIHRPINRLNDNQLYLLWYGNNEIKGINDFFNYLEKKSYKIQYRVMLSRYRGKTTCQECMGTRLKKETGYVKINNKSIIDILLMPLDVLLIFFKTLKTNEENTRKIKNILPEIINRLDFLIKLGLGYLTLNRSSNSLSGGESQRINIAKSIGGGLIGSIYILDEPSIGLHPKDTKELIIVLKALRNLGNTVIVVEHEEEIIKAADEIIDIGPMAGIFGGQVIFQGKYEKLIEANNSITADYLNGTKNISIPKQRRKSKNKLKITGINENNLKNIDIEVPLNSFVCVTGVSGSGKSTLVKNVILPCVKNKLGIYGDKQGDFITFKANMDNIQSVDFVDQNPIGKSSRSNPATYVKAFDDIRELFSRQGLSKARGYKPGFFSYNVPGGRCEVCEGDGEIVIGMQFMADVNLICRECNGKRYKNETLDIKYRNKNISDILNMDIKTAFDFFKNSDKRIEEKIILKITPLIKVGLGYLKLGQSLNTLSGGESQRIKLASFLAKKNKPTLFIFDEPTTGLHFHDINKLILAFNELIKEKHSIIVIEHNIDVIKCSDYIIDLGPDGGENGGDIVFNGTPEDIINCKTSITGKYLKNKIC